MGPLNFSRVEMEPHTLLNIVLLLFTRILLIYLWGFTVSCL